MVEVRNGLVMNKLEISCDLRDRIVQTQANDPDLQRRINNPEFFIAADGAILYSGRLCVPNDVELKRL
ncbi:hypothetical protein A2U01_0091730, partial [Trifolium medium]|nr:hypothetical protein [Trifolium medium]